jgi:hypothetical protein
MTSGMASSDLLGSLTIVVAHHMYSMPPSYCLWYPTLSLFTHHMWIGGFLVVGAAAHPQITLGNVSLVVTMCAMADGITIRH